MTTSAPAITIDVRMLGMSGIGTYIAELSPRIITAFPEAHFFLLGDLDRLAGLDWSRASNVTTLACEAPIYSMVEQRELAKRTPKETLLFWSPHYIIPLLYRGKLLVTVHDVFHLAMPHYVGGLHKRLYARAMFAALRRKANAIITDSEFSCRELLRLTGPGRQEVTTISIGVDTSWFNVQKKERPHLRPYLLYVGNVKPHKNLAGLLAAFERVLGELPQDLVPDLVIVGKREGFITGDAAVAERARALGDRVRFTGYVEDPMLRQYVAHAEALVLPSFYEGFGLPPLEAMACGCPVIVSNVASLPEVCGDAALYCDPYSPADIAAKILRLMTDAQLRNDLRTRGLKRAAGFTWEACAQRTAAVIAGVLAA